MSIKKTFIANLNPEDENNDLKALSVLTKEQANLIHLQSKLLLQQAESFKQLLESFGICEEWYNTKRINLGEVFSTNKMIGFNSHLDKMERKGG
jgi:hypothetical protein